MAKPLISVVVTTKNEESNLPRLLESVNKQTFKHFEVVVVDNKSTDNTLSIAQKYTRKIFTKGPERSAQRNFGVSKASGKYVLILDADMELSRCVLKDCVNEIENSEYKALVIPEKTVGDSFMAKVRKFEREMYMGDMDIEVARFFDKKVFEEFGGYDTQLTGAEDYDLPKRIMSKYKIGRTKEYIYHHEGNLTLLNQLRKKYYYASKSVVYADKHPDLIKKQGILIYRRSYLKHWKKLISNPLMTFVFLFVRTLETSAAAWGYLRAAGPVKFMKTFIKIFTE